MTQRPTTHVIRAHARMSGYIVADAIARRRVEHQLVGPSFERPERRGNATAVHQGDAQPATQREAQAVTKRPTPEAIADLLADAALGDEAAAMRLGEIVLGKRAVRLTERLCVRLAERFREVRRVMRDPSDN